MILLMLVSSNLHAQTTEIQTDQAPCSEGEQEGQAPCIVGTAWGLSLAADGSGFYNDYMKMLLNRLEEPASYAALPYHRANKAFAERRADCIYPSTVRVHVTDPSEALKFNASRPMTMNRVFIFSQYGQPPLKTVGEMTGKRVGHVMGSAFPETFNNLGIVFVPVVDETSKANLLIRRRLDFMVGTLPDTELVFQALGQELPPHGPQDGMINYSMTLVCHASPANDALIRAVNSAIARLVDTRETEKLLRDAGISDAQSYVPEELE